MTEPKNQCDGCAAGMPVEDGIHRSEWMAFMVCTKDKYEPKTAKSKSEYKRLKAQGVDVVMQGETKDIDAALVERVAVESELRK